ncbi:MAG: dephospho-CoA kinase [Pseudomonadota bacterium]|nr:dephospho-CoA kinase [Pseudomonadota bacterium]
MIVLGLTGSIGMGKSTAAEMLRRLGVPVSDADAIVHELIGPGGRAVSAVEDSFPGVTKAGAVDRAVLGAKVFGDPDALKTLEQILHPLVEAQRDRFLKQSRRSRKRVVALDIPLLYEVEADKLCDATIVVSASSILQETRVLARHGMTKEKLESIRKQQMSDLEKRQHATFIVPTGNGRRSTLQALTRIVRLSRNGLLPAPARR